MKENSSEDDISKERLRNLSPNIEHELQPSLGSLDDQVRKQFENLRRVQDQIKLQREQLPEIYHQIFSNMRFIAARGWYVSLNVVRDVPMNELGDLFREENVERFEQLLINLADSVIPRLLKRCAVRFPNRAEVFEEIEKLYGLKSYRAVVLLSYTQVDGMSNDFWGFGFFDKDRRQDFKLRSYLKLQELDRGISSGIADQLAISLNEITVNSADNIFANDPTLSTRTFNRHHIMHGHSIMYGTKVNAIRAIDLLDFLCYWTNEKGKSVLED